MVGDGHLDDVDRAVLRELQDDGRRPFREIARKLSVSERTVRARVRRMQEIGALHIVAFADPVRLGHSTLAMVLLRVETGAHEHVVAALSSWPEVSYVSSLLGRSDIYFQVVCRDTEDLWRLVGERLGALAGVLESETMLEMKVHKFIYTYPNPLGG